MVKVSELRGQAPGESRAWSTSFRDLFAPRRIPVPSISAHIPDVRTAFGVLPDDPKRALTGFQSKPSGITFSASAHLTITTFRDRQREGLTRRFLGPWAAAMDTSTRIPIFTKPTIPKLPPENIECIRALGALEEGDEAPFWHFVEKQLGRPPDDLLLGVLDRYFLPHGRRLPSWVFVRLLDHHRRRLTYAKPGEWYDWLAGEVYLRLRKTPGRRLMASLQGYPVSPYEILKIELPKALAIAESEGLFGGYLGNPRSWHNEFMLGDVERQIVHANRPLRDTRKRQKRGDDERWDAVVSLEVLSGEERKQFLAAPDLEEEFANLENERWERRRDELYKKLSPKERELIHFLRRVYDQEKHGDSPVDAAAQHLGKAPSTVRVQMHQITQYLCS
jgi:hypothetical protein